jgi:proton-translocating NADH-quinone oxidoreductase chain N
VRSLGGIYAAAGLAVSGTAVYRMYLDYSLNPTSQPAGGIFSAFLSTDMLSIYMSFIFVGIGLLVCMYSIKCLENESGKPLYYALLLSLVSGMVGVVFAGDLFTLYVFWEMMALSSYVLVAFNKETWEPAEAGFKYMIMSTAGSATFLFGMALLYGMAGTLNIQALASAFTLQPVSQWLYIALIFMLVGFGVKAAIVPLHTWLPDAYTAASTPISAVLSGVVTETGVYALLRILFTVFLPIQTQWFGILAILSILTMTFGNLMAMLQDDVKRLLAYSSIAQIGYMLVGLAVGTPLGLTGTLLQLFNHALMKSAAFLCAGAIIFRLESRSLKDMAGIGRRMPVTSVFFAISLFALIGIPPLNGFVSELTLFTSSVQANVGWLGVAIVLNSVISSVYSLRVLSTLIQPSMSEAVSMTKEAPLLMLIPEGVLAVLIVLFGIYPGPIMNLAQQAASGLLSVGLKVI